MNHLPSKFQWYIIIGGLEKTAREKMMKWDVDDELEVELLDWEIRWKTVQ